MHTKTKTNTENQTHTQTVGSTQTIDQQQHNYLGLVHNEWHSRRMAENGFASPSWEFCRHILSCRELKAESFKKCLHSMHWGVSL